MVVNHNYMPHECAKGFLDLNFNQAIIDKISIFHEIAAPPILHTHKHRNFSSRLQLQLFLDQLFLRYKFHGSGM